jgi:thiol-disulfide isomerase/thioredoxin
MKTGPAILAVLSLWLAVSAADPVAEFSLPGIDGRQYTLDEYAGKWIIINYWATNCPPCIKEIPELQDFSQRHENTDAVVLGVNYEDIKLSWLKDFIDSMKMSYPVLLAEADSVTPFGPISMLPTTFIVSPSGKLMGQQRGAITAEMLDKYLQKQAEPTQVHSDSRQDAGKEETP